jgi:hypothetical protein
VDIGITTRIRFSARSSTIAIATERVTGRSQRETDSGERKHGQPFPIRIELARMTKLDRAEAPVCDQDLDRTALTSPSHLALQIRNFPLSRVLPQAPQQFPQRFPGDPGRPALVEQGEGFLVFYCVSGLGVGEDVVSKGYHPPS